MGEIDFEAEARAMYERIVHRNRNMFQIIVAKLREVDARARAELETLLRECRAQNTAMAETMHGAYERLRNNAPIIAMQGERIAELLAEVDAAKADGFRRGVAAARTALDKCRLIDAPTGSPYCAGWQEGLNAAQRRLAALLHGARR